MEAQCLDLAISICNNERFLGRKTKHFEVVYFDLESSKRRPRDRIIQILGTDRKIPKGFFLLTAENDVGKIGDGFEGNLEQILSEHTGIGLVVIDVFQLIRQKQGRSQNAYDFDYSDLSAIKKRGSCFAAG